MRALSEFGSVDLAQPRKPFLVAPYCSARSEYYTKLVFYQ
nr:MAG TPA: hypothetical protein [Caudoviricetes sp.]